MVWNNQNRKIWIRKEQDEEYVRELLKVTDDRKNYKIRIEKIMGSEYKQVLVEFGNEIDCPF